MSHDMPHLRPAYARPPLPDVRVTGDRDRATVNEPGHLAEPALQDRRYAPMTAYSWLKVFLILIVGALIGLWLSPRAGYGAEPLTRVNEAPYGGCKEAWMAPRSEGADWCRDRGWVVRSRFVITPKKLVVHNRMRPCPREDSGNCYWDADRRGNQEGWGFIIKGQRDGKHRVWIARFPRCGEGG